MMSVRLPENIDMRLEQLSHVTKRSKSFYIKEALTRYLEDVADYYIAADRLNNLGTLLTTEELVKGLKKKRK